MQWTEGLKLPLLAAGKHASPDKGLCAMEMVAFIERLPHSDMPECTCRVIGAFVRGFNDLMTDEERQRLIPYLPLLVGTVSPEHERARGEFAAWKAIKVFAPLALQDVLPVEAEKLKNFDVSKGLGAAWSAAWSAAYAAANAAAEGAANAAKSAAWSAAYAAKSAAESAANAAWSAAESAAKSAAESAAKRSQIISTAFDLINEMLAIGPKGAFTKDPQAVKTLLAVL